MKSNIDLLAEAMAAAEQTIRKATIEEALHRQRQAGAELAGIGWEGDLDAMRYTDVTQEDACSITSNKF